MRILTVLIAVSLVALQSAAVTIHRSFRTREAGFGFGTGRTGVAYPVDARIAAAIDEGRKKAAEKVKVVIGKVTRICSGDTIHVVTDGNVKFKVRLDRIDAPENDQPFGKEAADYLATLVKGRTVRVEWVKNDLSGCLLGIVYTQNIKARIPAARNTDEGASQSGLRQTGHQPAQNETAMVKGWYDVNLLLVTTGNAHHRADMDKTPSYVAAESAAKVRKLGLWASDGSAREAEGQ